jgi:O-antigen/teichoic acid export membrane protein
MISNLLIKIGSKFNLQIDKRTINYNKNIVLMLLFKVISILISFFYVPLYLKAFNLDDYGLFLTLTSIIGWFALLDVGLSNGLRNLLTKALAEKDYNYAKALVSTTYAAVFFYTMAIFTLFFIISQFIDWTVVLNVSHDRNNELKLVSTIVFGSFCLNFFFGVINTILFSLQLPFYQSLFSLISQILTFFSVFILVNFLNYSDLITVSSFVSFIPPLVLFICSIILFNKKFAHFKPSLRKINFSLIKDIMNLGLKFFVIQIITLIIFQSNNLIISHTAGNDSVVVYSIALRYIESTGIIFTIFIMPIWSASTDALIRHDYDWIKKTIKNVKLVATIIFIVGCFLILISDFVFSHWLGVNNVKISILNLVLVLLFITFRNYYQCYGYVVNGSGKIKAQLFITMAVAVLYIPIAYYLGNVFGLNGVLIVLVASQFINVLWSRYQYNLIINNKVKGFWNE